MCKEAGQMMMMIIIDYPGTSSQMMMMVLIIDVQAQLDVCCKHSEHGEPFTSASL